MNHILFATELTDKQKDIKSVIQDSAALNDNLLDSIGLLALITGRLPN